MNEWQNVDKKDEVDIVIDGAISALVFFAVFFAVVKVLRGIAAGE